MMIDCPLCNGIRSAALINRFETVIFKGKSITYDAQLYKCKKCTNEFDDKITGKYNNDQIDEKYRECETIDSNEK